MRGPSRSPSTSRRPSARTRAGRIYLAALGSGTVYRFAGETRRPATRAIPDRWTRDPGAGQVRQRDRDSGRDRTGGRLVGTSGKDVIAAATWPTASRTTGGRRTSTAPAVATTWSRAGRRRRIARRRRRRSPRWRRRQRPVQGRPGRGRSEVLLGVRHAWVDELPIATRSAVATMSGMGRGAKVITFVLALAFAGFGAPAGEAATVTWTLQPIGNFSSPVFVTSDPTNPDREFVVEKDGTITASQNGVNKHVPRPQQPAGPQPRLRVRLPGARPALHGLPARLHATRACSMSSTTAA